MTDFENSQYYTNRELSWIQFNYRVLEEARDKANPLFERLKFLSITASNLDEFFMVRVASLKDMVEAGYDKPDIAGMKPKEQLSKISEAVHAFTQMQYSTYNRSLLPLLEKEGIQVVPSYDRLTPEEAQYVDQVFMEKVYPVLTPMAVDSSRPFPLVRNRSLNIAALIRVKEDDGTGSRHLGLIDSGYEDEPAARSGRPAEIADRPAGKNDRADKSDKADRSDKSDKADKSGKSDKAGKAEDRDAKQDKQGRHADKAEKKAQDKGRHHDRHAEEDYEFATVQMPAGIPRLIRIPSESGIRLILLEEVIRGNINRLFLGYDVICTCPYRVERNADLDIDEEEAEDLLKEIQKQLRRRAWGEVIKLEVHEGIDKRLLKYLKRELEVTDEDVYRISGPLDLTYLMKAYGMDGFDRYKAQKHVPAASPDIDPELSIFENIRRGDIFLHHPYVSFDPVVEFVRQAAVDPQVLAIKQTLYRVSGNSPIVAALARAAENGKQVTVLVELKARFDEENNINWAKTLEKAGCHVLYGLRGLKTHSKITLIVRDEEDGIRRYVHLGTGNYNDATAKLYTDCGLMTCKERYGEDATAVFNMLSGYSEPENWNLLAVAPLWLRDRFLSWIRREADFARAGKPARIVAKMNSLCDKEIIASLYEASAAGVRIELIIRGICCVKTGIPGISENIHVRSLVGPFLEHSRIFWFRNGGDDEVYMGSADWMPRNLDRRVEITFPVLDKRAKEAAIHILEAELQDTMRARVMRMDGSGEYERRDRRGKAKLDSQILFTEEARAAEKHEPDVRSERVFIPLEAPDTAD